MFYLNKTQFLDHNIMRLRSKLNFIDTIVLKFNLTYLISNLTTS